MNDPPDNWVIVVPPDAELSLQLGSVRIDPVTREHARALHALNLADDPEALRFLPFLDPPGSIAGWFDRCAKWEQRRDDDGRAWFSWAVIDPSTETIVGLALGRTRDDTPVVELAVAIGRAWRSRKRRAYYGRDCVRAALDVMFTRARVRVVRLDADKDNEPSLALVARLNAKASQPRELNGMIRSYMDYGTWEAHREEWGWSDG